MAKESRIIAWVDEFGCREWSEIGVGVNWDAILKNNLGDCIPNQQEIRNP